MRGRCNGERQMARALCVLRRMVDLAQRKKTPMIESRDIAGR